MGESDFVGGPAHHGTVGKCRRLLALRVHRVEGGAVWRSFVSACA